MPFAGNAYFRIRDDRFAARAPSSRSGTALLAVASVMVLIGALGLALVQTAVSSSAAIVFAGERSQARTAAEAAAELAIEELWSGFELDLAGAAPTPAAFRAYATGLGLANQAGTVPPARTDWRAIVGLPVDGAGRFTYGAFDVRELLVHREDLPRSVRIHIKSTVALQRGATSEDDDDAEYSLERVWSIEPPPWEGLDFALLANNVNCIMCHTEIDSAERFYRVATEDGQYDRVRAGSIESFQFREDPDSFIAGTLYVGGRAFDSEGRTISDWGAFNLNAARMDSTGHLVEDAFGDLHPENLSPADPATPLPFENLYLDYFNLGPNVDGILPETFPPPFPDDGGYDIATGTDLTEGAGNRQVDDAEFDATVALFDGDVTGGTIAVVGPDDRITSTTELSGLLSGTTSRLAARTEGQVLMVGTEEDPIRLDGSVAIDGDVILSGYVIGEGSLWARGNVYLRGDVRYLDGQSGGDRTWRRAANGTENALAITAGGNIVVGDLFRESFGTGGEVDGTPAGGWNFTLEETAIFNRREWIKTQPELPGERYQTITGYRTETRTDYEWVGTGEMYEAPVYERVAAGTREVPVYETVVITPATEYRPAVTERVLTGYRTETVYDNVQVGTETRERTERISTATYDVEVPIYEWVTPYYANPDYAGPDYHPRYYAFDEGLPIPILNLTGHFDPAIEAWIGDERADGWDLSKLTLADPTDPSDPLLFDASGDPIASISTLLPTDDWLDDELLRELIDSALADRDETEPFEIDATIYSSNAIFGVIPDGDGTNGELIVRGAVVGSDVGLLGPNGTTILYDEAGANLLDIRDPNRVGVVRLLTAPAPLPVN